MKAHGLALTHRTFLGFLTLWASLKGAFFNVGFFGPSPLGSRPSLVGWAKLTPLHITYASCLINQCYHSYCLFHVLPM